MKTGPDVARVAALVGDPARANILTALMAGRAVTTSELAQEAGVTIQTASSHLAKLHHAQLVKVRKQGRHRYYQLDGDDVAHLLETLMGIAARSGQTRVRTGPKEPALRKARVCYDHLAGEYGVLIFESLCGRGGVSLDADLPALTRKGRKFCTEFGIDLSGLERMRRPLCRQCLDWSVRRSHLAGSLGMAFLNRFYDLGWASREASSRIVVFNRDGERAFLDKFGI